MHCEKLPSTEIGCGLSDAIQSGMSVDAPMNLYMNRRFYLYWCI